jgi:hypothetical protein
MHSLFSISWVAILHMSTYFWHCHVAFWNAKWLIWQ